MTSVDIELLLVGLAAMLAPANKDRADGLTRDAALDVAPDVMVKITRTG